MKCRDKESGLGKAKVDTAGSAYDSGPVEAWLPTEQQSSPAPCLASHCPRWLGPGPTSVWSQAGPRGHALKHSRHNTRAPPPHTGLTSCIQLYCLRSSSVSRLSAVSVQSVSSVSQSVRQVSPSSPTWFVSQESRCNAIHVKSCSCHCSIVHCVPWYWQMALVRTNKLSKRGYIYNIQRSPFFITFLWHWLNIWTVSKVTAIKLSSQSNNRPKLMTEWGLRGQQYWSYEWYDQRMLTQILWGQLRLTACRQFFLHDTDGATMVPVPV